MPPGEDRRRGKRRRSALLRGATAAAACLAAVLSSGACAGRAASAPPEPVETPHAAVVRLAAKIRKADYEADGARLNAGFMALEPYGEGPLASRARYWRGFALWRRALKGFNDNAPRPEIAADLKGAIEEFRRALAADPQFVDARVGEASCIASLAFIGPPSERLAGFRRQWELLSEAKKQAPESPRLAWALGAAQWYAPPAMGGGQDKAFATYREGLEWAKTETVADEADPAWGRPELLMNLAFASLNAATPDLDAADRYAREALALVPDWHYVRDILIPQIAAARAKG